MDIDKKKASVGQKDDPQNAGKQGQSAIKSDSSPPEFFGPKGPEPTRYGDWEQKGRCTDF